jgi:hypothetical protein
MVGDIIADSRATSPGIRMLVLLTPAPQLTRNFARPISCLEARPRAVPRRKVTRQADEEPFHSARKTQRQLERGELVMAPPGALRALVVAGRYGEPAGGRSRCRVTLPIDPPLGVE